jgi:hypothetical protein
MSKFHVYSRISSILIWDKRPMDHVSLWVLLRDRHPLYLRETTISLSNWVWHEQLAKNIYT